jgi:mannose-6-phosphate isomerase-like protein (cupin superfamily)
MNQILKIKFQKLFKKMSLKQNSKINFVKGNEGTKIKQYFHPYNTLNEIKYSLAQFTLDISKKTKLHKIKSSEIYYILEGKGKLKINEKIFYLEKDDSAYVPPNSTQFIENIGTKELRFLCIVEPAWKIEDENILE